jgi:hypothetical protein
VKVREFGEQVGPVWQEAADVFDGCEAGGGGGGRRWQQAETVSWTREWDDRWDDGMREEMGIALADEEWEDE